MDPDFLRYDSCPSIKSSKYSLPCYAPSQPTKVSADVYVSPSGTEQYTVQVVMGKRDVPEIEMCARAIMAAIKAHGCTKPLLLALGLSKHCMMTIRAVVDQVGRMRVW